MKNILLKGLISLGILLMVSSCKDVDPYVIDTDRGELVREIDGQVERIACIDEQAARVACFDERDINIISRCLKRCRK